MENENIKSPYQTMKQESILDMLDTLDSLSMKLKKLLDSKPDDFLGK